MTVIPTPVLLLRAALACVAGCAAGSAFAQPAAPAVEVPTPGQPGLDTAQPDARPGFITGKGVLDAANPDVVMTLRAGVQVSPAYLGSSEEEFGPDAAFRFDYIRFPGGFDIGSGNTVGFQTGLGLRGSARFIGKRDSGDYDEIRGLDDVPLTFEAGLGLGYEQRNYRAFADVRYGVVGHHAWVGELVADGIVYPLEGLTVTLGPRLEFGTDNFAQTYFGVSASEAAESDLAAFDASGGLLGAGVELGARYLLNERWGVEGVAGWARLMNDAADSPITETGSADQYRVRIGLTRRISLDF